MELLKEENKKVEETQNKAKEIGHCLCSMVIKCPCKVFKVKGVCKCSGDNSLEYKEWLRINKEDMGI